MFPEIHRRVKHKAVALSRIEGITQCEAARLCGISERTLRRAKAREIAHGDIDGAKKKRGRKSIWVPAFKDVTSCLLAV
jgi:transposase-like protein